MKDLTPPIWTISSVESTRLSKSLIHSRSAGFLRRVEAKHTHCRSSSFATSRLSGTSFERRVERSISARSLTLTSFSTSVFAPLIAGQIQFIVRNNRVRTLERFIILFHGPLTHLMIGISPTNPSASTVKSLTIWYASLLRVEFMRLVEFGIFLKVGREIWIDLQSVSSLSLSLSMGTTLY